MRSPAGAASIDFVVHRHPAHPAGSQQSSLEAWPPPPRFADARRGKWRRRRRGAASFSSSPVEKAPESRPVPSAARRAGGSSADPARAPRHPSGRVPRDLLLPPVFTPDLHHETRAATLPPRIEYLSAAARRHASPKAMLVDPLPVPRTIRRLHRSPIASFNPIQSSGQTVNHNLHRDPRQLHGPEASAG